MFASFDPLLSAFFPIVLPTLNHFSGTIDDKISGIF
jgi:hypothetical protein